MSGVGEGRRAADQEVEPPAVRTTYPGDVTSLDCGGGGLPSEWSEARAAVVARIQADPQFHEVVRCYGGRPSAAAPSRRCRRLSLRVCDRLDLNPAVWLGTVYGAAAEYIEAARP